MSYFNTPMRRFHLKSIYIHECVCLCVFFVYICLFSGCNPVLYIVLCLSTLVGLLQVFLRQITHIFSFTYLFMPMSFECARILPVFENSI